MEQFTATIHHLESKIDACSSCLGKMEQRLDSMENRLDSMDQTVASLDMRFKALDGYLLEVVRRERDIMQEFRDLNYSGNST